MSLIYFHRFLIFCAILFALFFAWYSWDQWQATATVSMLIAAIASALTAVGLALYLRTVRLPQRPGGE